MNNKDESICRLCLKASSGQFKVLDEVAQEVLDTVLLKVSLSATESPAMCRTCSESLRKSFDFKAACLAAESRLISLAVATEGGAPLDLRRACPGADGDDADAGSDVCRFCVRRVASGRYTKLDALEEAMGMASDMLPKYLPEIDLSLTEDPVICTPCLASLEAHFSFAMACWSAEGHVKKYLEVEGCGGRARLGDVVRFTLVNAADDEEGGGGGGDEREGVIFVGGDAYDSAIEKELLERMQESEAIGREECVPIGSRRGSPSSSQTEAMPYGDQSDGDDGSLKSDDDNQESVHAGLPEATTYKRKRSARPSGPDALHECGDCPYRTKRKSHLKLHALSHGGVSQTPTYACELCPYLTRKKYDVTRHMRSRHKKPPAFAPLKCNVCPFETEQRLHLRVHNLTHRHPLDLTMYKCDACAYQTRRKYRLKDHMLTHMDAAEVPLYQCEVCSFKTKQKFCLRRHMRVHNASGTAFKCDKCEFESRIRRVLERHLVIHRDPSQAKAFKCDYCPYRAKRRSRLKDHMLTHKDPSEVTMFKCETCSFETKKKFSLKRHRLIHERAPDADSCGAGAPQARAAS